MRELERELSEPTREPGLIPDFWLPLLQALATGFFVGAAVTLATSDKWRWERFWLAMVASALAMWLWRLEVSREALWKLETLIDRDLTGDDIVGAPAREVEPERVPVRLELQGERTLRFVDVDLGPTELRQWARLALSGSLGERDIKAMLGLSRGDWARLREHLLEQGFLRWRSPNSRNLGVELTGKGQALARGLLEDDLLDRS